jgi:hypothetical protein
MPARDDIFDTLKRELTITQVADFLGLRLKPRSNGELRMRCPACNDAADNTLSLNPTRQVYTCFAVRPWKRGDLTGLVCHIRGLSNHQSAALLAEHFNLNSVDKGERSAHTPIPQEPPGGQAAGIVAPKAIERLAHLDAHHEALQGFGIAPETFEYFEAGFAKVGVLKGRLLVPIKTADGTLVAYCGISVKDEQQPRLMFYEFKPETAFFNRERVTSKEAVYVARDPLDVLMAYEGGVENIISFLSPISSPSLQALSLWMDQEAIEIIELL